MATKQGSGTINNFGVWLYTWLGLANGDVGNGFQAPGFPDKSVQVTGTWGAAGAVQIEGSNDNVSWAQLHDQTGTAISLSSSNPVALIAESVMFVRPHVTGGDGTTALAVSLCATRAK
jgi:hypothetical protein